MRRGLSGAADFRVSVASGPAVWPLKHFAPVVMLLLPLAAIAAAPARSFDRPGALLLNVTESDLNRIVVGSFLSNGGPEFQGSKRRSSAAVSDLTYRAKLSEPLLALEEGGKASLTFDIREGNLRIGRIERKIAGRSASCEDTRVYVDPTRPLDVTLGLDFRIENGDLRIVPDRVSLPDAEHRLNLVKPERCTNAPLPRWLLWWIGKPTLKRYLDNLDDLLLERAKKSATRIEERRDLLRKSWQVADGSRVHLYPTSLDTGHGSLFVSLEASSEPPAAGTAARFDARGLPGDRSYVALSESFVNDLARIAISRTSSERLRPTGNLGKLLRSSSAYALIPGLRGLASTEKLLYSVAFHAPPRIEFKAGAGGDAIIHMALSDIELRLYKEEVDHATTLLGALAVKSGNLAVVPYRGVLGGISFRILENEWVVSSSGIRFDDALVAATLQEVTFSRFFETTYRPLAVEHWRLGSSGFAPLAFHAEKGYLVIDVGEAPSAHEERAERAPMRTAALPASR